MTKPAKCLFNRYRLVMAIIIGGFLILIALAIIAIVKAVPPSKTAMPRDPQTNQSQTQTTTQNLPATPTPIHHSSPIQYGVAAGGGLTALTQNELDLYFQQLKELGVEWLRWDFNWKTVQPNGPEDYNWNSVDRVVKAAGDYNMRTLGTIDYAPEWAQQPVCAGAFACPPADPAVFGVFAREIAARYASQGLHYWEIWNEPNYYKFWQPTPNPYSYALFLESAYEAIKEADPEAVVLTGGLAAVDNGNNNIAPITFIRKLYETDAAGDFDGIALHPYTYPAMPSPLIPWNSWQQLNTIRQLMVKNGDNQKLIWITEYGAPTGGPGNPRNTVQGSIFSYGQDYMTESSQAMIAAEALRLIPQMENWLGPFFWYSLKDEGTSRDTVENFFGLLRFDGSKKPAYYKFQEAIAK